MARQKVSVRINQFSGGFNTEANLMNFPEGASLDEQNMDLLGDGSRKRRNGFDTDLGTPVNTNVKFNGSNIGKNQFLWKNAGGFVGREFIVVQIGNYVGIHSLTTSDISNNRLYSFRVTDAGTDTNFGFTSVDGILLIATGLGSITSVQYDGRNFTRSSDKILIRDLFGVKSDFTDVENLQTRSEIMGDPQLYNLRNQTFGLPHPNGAGDEDYSEDPIRAFYEASGKWPSNADNVNLFLVADANFESNRTVERFNPESMRDSPPFNTPAPKGSFIIEALARGPSREKVFRQLHNRHSNKFELRGTVSLPADTTKRGATVVAQYAGRAWFAGFGGDVTDGDNRSPRLSSYVMFSQTVKDPSQTFKCYQEADPTSHIDPDLVDTDGGFIKLDGAYGINAMLSVESSLFVFAENGVWRIVGIDENSFTATSYTVNKMSDKGCVSGNSVVDMEGALIYWGDSSIQALIKDQYGSWSAQDLTENTIRSFYQSLSPIERESVVGYYDEVTSTARWLYGKGIGVRNEVSELILSKKFQVFTKNKLNLNNSFGPITVSGGSLGDDSEEVVTVSGEVVTVNGENVTSPSTYEIRAASLNFYCTLTQLYPTIRYTFGGYNNSETPLDWVSISPIDTPAYITTGFVTGGEARLSKGVPYITTLFEKVDEPTPSCFLQTRWDWSGGPSTGRWTAPRQIYRNVRKDEDTVVVTRNKVRGMGKSVAFNLSSEPGKFFHIYGWEHNLEATTNE